MGFPEYFVVFSFASLSALRAEATVLEVSVDLEDFVRYQPEQIHLSVNGEKPKMQSAISHYIISHIALKKKGLIPENGDTVTATWSTEDDTRRSLVEFGLGSPACLDRRAEGGSTRFAVGGRRTQFVHRAAMEGLSPNSTYCELSGGNKPLFQHLKCHVFCCCCSGK